MLNAFRLFFDFLNTGHHINKRGWARVLEVFCIALLTGSAVVFLPMLSKCRLQDRSLMLRDSAGCLSEEDIFQISTLNNPKIEKRRSGTRMEHCSYRQSDFF